MIQKAILGAKGSRDNRTIWVNNPQRALVFEW